MFSVRLVFPLLRLCVRTGLKIELLETTVLLTCVCLCYFRACFVTPCQTIASASAAISRIRITLHRQEVMKNMSDKIHGYQNSYRKWEAEKGKKYLGHKCISLFIIKR